MTQSADPNRKMTDLLHPGIWSVLFGALAMLLVGWNMFGSVPSDTPSIGAQIGEIAGEMKRSAWRSFLGLPPPAPEPKPLNIADHLPFVAVGLGVLAIVLSIISGIRGQDRHFLVYGSALGAGAIVMQVFWWVALLVVGMILIVSIIENLGDFFSF